MAGVPSQALATFEGWPQGVNNRAAEESVPGRALREAVNVDLDDAGKPRRRPGAALAQPAAGLHSLWAHDRFPLLLGAQGGSLVAFDMAEDMQTLGEPLTAPDAPVSFDWVAGSVYFSNRTDCGMVLEDGRVIPWAPEHPGGQPLAEVQANAGGLAAGIYQVAVTFLDADGRESGATLPVELELAAGQGITLSHFPVSADPRTTAVRVYCSKPNGETLFAVQDLPIGLTSFLLGAHTSGAILDKLFLTAMPPGQIVRAFGGRLHVFRGPLHCWSEALTYGLTKAHESFARYDADITLGEPVGQAEGSGMFVAVSAGAGKRAGRTYYLAGPNPKNWQRVIAYPYGAVPGSATQLDGKALGLDAAGLVPVWLADNGQFVIGLPGGSVMQLHSERYVAPEQAEHASIALREVNGLRHLVATMRGGRVSGLAAVDLAEAEVWKDGEQIS